MNQNTQPDPLLRVHDIVGRPARGDRPAIPALVPVCKATWWAGVASGRFPKGTKLSPRVTVWRRSEIQRLIDGAVGQPAANEPAGQDGAP